MARITNIQLRKDTAANWTSTNPTLSDGEVGIETNTGKFKIGNNYQPWNVLSYATDVSKITGTILNSSIITSYLLKLGLSTAGPVTTDASGNLSSSATLPIENGGTNSTSQADLTTNIPAQVYPPFVSGSYYRSDIPAASATANLNTLYLLPFYVGKTTTFDRIACYVTTFSTGGDNRLGIYKDTNGTPSTLILDAGTVAVTAVGLYEITVSLTLTPGWYWLAACAQTSGSYNVLSRGSTGASKITQRNSTSTTVAGAIYAITVNSITGAFPASLATGYTFLLGSGNTNGNTSILRAA